MSSEKDIEDLIRRLEATGCRIWIKGDVLRVEPKPSTALLSELKAQREAVFTFVKSYGRFPGERVGSIELEALRCYCPELFKVIKAPNGQQALLWGVTAHGLILSYDPCRPLYTVRP
jgi:hypothetical protein